MKNSYSYKKGIPEKQVMTLFETQLAERQIIYERTHIVAGHTITIPPYHNSIIPLQPVNHTFETNLQPNTLLKLEENPFLFIEQLTITIVPVLNGHTMILRETLPFEYVKESDYIEKHQIDQQDNIGEVTEISHQKLPPMPQKPAFMFHHNFTQNQE